MDVNDREKQQRELWLVTGVILGALVLLIPGAVWGLPAGKAINGAQRILRGEVPYRDFWSMYAPGQFYAIAALFRLFGSKLIVQGIAVVMVQAVTVGAVFRLVRHLGGDRRIALIISSLLVVGFWTTAPELTTYPPALLFLLFALDKLVRYIQGSGCGDLWKSGLLLGLAAWFKHDIAAYVAVGSAVALGTSWWLVGERRPAYWISPVAAIKRLAAASILVVLPVALFIACKAGADAWQDLFVFPATRFRAVRGESFEPLWPRLEPFLQWSRHGHELFRARVAMTSLSQWILCNLPQYVFILGGALVWMKRRVLDPPILASAVLLLANLPLFWIVAHVQRNTHLTSMAVLSFCLAGLIWGARKTTRPWLRRIVTGGFMIYAVGVVIPGTLAFTRAVTTWSTSRTCGMAGAFGIRVRPKELAELQPIVDFIRSHTAVNERIYAGVMRHDAVVASNMRFYYLTGRRNSCRYDELHPGVVDRRETQQEIIDALKRYQVRCVVLWDFGWSKHVLDQIKTRYQAAAPDGGSELLDRYLAGHFKTIARFGEYVLQWRNDAPLPAGAEALPNPMP